MMDHDIIIASEVDVPEGMEEQLRKVILAALAAQGVDQGCEINVMLTDDGGIRRVNQAMRGVDAATDVLSFPMGENGEYDLNEDTGAYILGDVVISMEKAVEQAEMYGHSLSREVGFLTVHSMLHLLGYDHENGGIEAVIMREKEETVLSRLGLSRDASYVPEQQ